MNSLQKMPTDYLLNLHEALGTLRDLAKDDKVPCPFQGICSNIMKLTNDTHLHKACIDVITDVAEHWRHGDGHRRAYPFGQEEPYSRCWTENKAKRLDLIRYTRLRISLELNRRTKDYGTL